MQLFLKARKQEVSDVESFTFTPDQPVSWQAGQYMHYVLPSEHADERGIERWFTISSAPFEQDIMLTTRFNEDKSSSFKQALRNLKLGDPVQADGPKGSFVIEDMTKKYILIAGGIGITPYHSILKQLDHDGAQLNAELLYANRDEKLVFGDELESFSQRNPRLNIQTFLGDNRIPEATLKAFLDEPNTVFYLSGPKPLVENYQHTLVELGAPEDRIKTDYFPGY